MPLIFVELTKPDAKILVHNHKNWFSNGSDVIDFLVAKSHVMCVYHTALHYLNKIESVCYLLWGSVAVTYAWFIFI